MTSSSSAIPQMHIHFIKKLLDDANKQLEFINNENPKQILRNVPKHGTDSIYGLTSKKATCTLKNEKISREIINFQSLLQKLGNEIVTYGTIDTLKNFITTHVEEVTDDHQLISDYFANKQELESLETQLHQANNNKNKMIQELEKRVLEMQLQRDDTRLEEACRVRMVKRWESSRCDQNAIMFHIKEQHLSRELHEWDVATDDDRMINFHTERFLDNCINNLLETIGEWDDRITRETDALEISMQHLSERQFKFEKKKKIFEELYEKHKQVIDEFNEKIQKEKELILMAKCSIKIQAWWRGVMVRKKLGPFKPKPKKKKKKKGGKRPRIY